MSQAAMDVVVSADGRSFEAAVPGEFDYKPVPVMAPLSFFVSAIAVIAFLWQAYDVLVKREGMQVTPCVVIALFAALALALSIVSLLEIRRSSGEIGGRRLTLAALLPAVLLMPVELAAAAYVHATEVPEGHERLSFSWLAKQAPYYEDGKLKLADPVLDLDGKHVFVKGYIYPGRQTTGLTQFVFLKDTGQCCFGGQPKLSDMILVDMQGEKTVDHDPINNQYRQYSVAGTFRAEPILQDGEVRQLYRLEANHVR